MSATKVALAVFLGMTFSVLSACIGNDDETAVQRLSKHELLTSLLPSDAVQIEELHCTPETAVEGAACRIVYATGIGGQAILRHYRDIYDGRGWQGLGDGPSGSPYTWNASWRDDTYKVDVRLMEPGSWPGVVPDGTAVVVKAAIVERKK